MNIKIIENEQDKQHCFDIRRVVFIDEQKVPAHEEYDAVDESCQHFLCALQNEPIGTARLHLISLNEAKVQRVAVLKHCRKLGVGKALMQAIEDHAKTRNVHRLLLAAQLEAIPFYQKLGYQTFGENFFDANIEHQMMSKNLA